MRALLKNTTFHAAVALLAIVLSVCLLGACGSSSQSPQALLDDTFSGRARIESANLNLSLGLDPAGSNASSKSLTVRISGPFQNVASNKLPHFALQLQFVNAGHALKAGATLTGSALFIELAGTSFSTPASTYKALEQGYEQAVKKASSEKTHSSFSSLGIEPRDWLSNPVKLGTATIAGVPTVHLGANVNVPGFLSDVSKLSQASGALGFAKAGSLSPSAVTELAKSIKSAHVDVYTGEHDHLLRRLEILATVGGTPQTRALLNGLSSAQLKVELELSAVNQPQTIRAPNNPQPASQLLPAVQQLVGALQGVTGSSSGGAPEPLQ